MTVKELKRILHKYADDTRVELHSSMFVGPVEKVYLLKQVKQPKVKVQQKILVLESDF